MNDAWPVAMNPSPHAQPPTRRASLRVMREVLGIFASVLLLTIAEPAAATPLGDLAASMKPGEWRQLTTNNIGIVSRYFADLGGVPTPAYDDNCMVWNTKKRRAMIATVTDPGSMPNPNSPLFTFDDATNAWTSSAGPGGTGLHCYDGLAWDDANEVMYWRPGLYGGGIVYRYCVNNNSPSWCVGRQGWSLLPDATLTGGCYQVAVALTYHATMDGGSLLCYDGERGIIQFRESVGPNGTWSTVIPGSHVSGTGPYHVCMEYSPIKRVSVFGCGGGAAFYKIDDNKVITQLQSFPVGGLNLGGGNNHDLVADPATGTFINIGGAVDTSAANAMYELNPDGNGTWTLVDSNLTAAGKICQTKIVAAYPCSLEFYGAANPTYGVLMFWKYTGTSSGEVWLYKHKTPAFGAPAPPSSLTVR